MLVVERPMPGVMLLQVEAHEDERGSFARCFCKDELDRLGIHAPFVQGNLSRNPRRGTLRGLHYQRPPHAETKIVQCLTGRVYDVVADLRPRSPTFGEWYAAELTGDNGRIMVVPEGCAHGFMTLEDMTIVHYMVTARHAPRHEAGLRHDDPTLAISWPMPATCISERDRSHPLLDVMDCCHLVQVPA